MGDFPGTQGNPDGVKILRFLDYAIKSQDDRKGATT
jgi:hypothetical protein